MIEGFAFNEADLAVNRLGKLTERQVERVRVEMLRRVKILAVLLAVGPAVVAAVVLGIVKVTGGDAGIDTAVAFGIAYVITLVLVMPTTVLAILGNYVRPIRNRTTGSVTGRIKLIERGDDVHLQMGRIISGPRFSLAPKQAAGLVAGEHYTIYFTPGGKRAVFHSIEQALLPRSDDADDEDTDDEVGAGSDAGG